MKTKMKPIHFFVPIERTKKTDKGLIVEGYAYVNAIVEAGGIDLTRKAMEAASADYLKWGAIREMHGPNAAGTATAEECGIVWDEKGAFLRALVVDKAAIEKCETGVYKGFSVGVRPQVMRGNKVESCVWIENSLVDRPADPDCPFTIARADGLDEAHVDDEIEVEQLEDQPSDQTAVERGAFAEKIASRENDMKRGLAFDMLYNVFSRIMRDATIADPEAAAREACAEFTDYVAPLFAQRGDLPDELCYSDQAALTRRAEAADGTIQTMTTERAALLVRAETAEASVTKLTGERDAAIERADKLAKEPAPMTPAVRFPQAVDRTFLANAAGEDATEVDALRTEYAGLLVSLPKEKDAVKRAAGVARMSVIKAQCNAAGSPL